jgi:serine/threonine protein kinase
VHCDVKPANIARRLDSGKYVLIDFGSAHEIERDDDHQPRENTMNIRGGEYVRIETRGYAPPELCFQPCRDIYAIGHVIRDCFGRDVPLEWSLIINRCIANVKENRYPDIDSLERDVLNVDRLGREEMRRCIYEDRLRFMRMQEEMAKEKAATFKWEELKERMKNAQSASDAIYAGAGQMFLDFAALSPCRSIRIIDPVALSEDRFVVIKGPGIIRVNMEAFLADKEGDVVDPGRKGYPAFVFLWDNVTLVNTTKKKLEDANVFYVVGDSCYLNFPNVSDKEIFNWKYAVTSNFGFSYAGYHGKKDMASLIRSMNRRLERNIPEMPNMVSAREFFSDGSDITIREYVAQNEIMREVLGMPKA